MFILQKKLAHKNTWFYKNLQILFGKCYDKFNEIEVKGSKSLYSLLFRACMCERVLEWDLRRRNLRKLKVTTVWMNWLLIVKSCVTSSDLVTNRYTHKGSSKDYAGAHNDTVRSQQGAVSATVYREGKISSCYLS